VRNPWGKHYDILPEISTLSAYWYGEIYKNA